MLALAERGEPATEPNVAFERCLLEPLVLDEQLWRRARPVGEEREELGLAAREPVHGVGQLFEEPAERQREERQC